MQARLTRLEALLGVHHAESFDPSPIVSRIDVLQEPNGSSALREPALGVSLDAAPEIAQLSNHLSRIEKVLSAMSAKLDQLVEHADSSGAPLKL